MNKTQKEEIRDIKEVLIEELKTIYKMIAVMQPKSEAEFIKVMLPNIHIRLFNLLTSQRDSLVEKIEEIKGVYDIEIRGGTEMIEKQEVITIIKQNK